MEQEITTHGTGWVVGGIAFNIEPKRRITTGGIIIARIKLNLSVHSS
jgi:hypothetical protein